MFVCFFASMQQVQDQNSSYVIIIVVINNDQSINDVMKAPTISAESWHRFSDLRFWFCFRRRFCDFLRFVSSSFLRFLDVQWSFLTCQQPKHGRRHRFHCDLKSNWQVDKIDMISNFNLDYFITLIYYLRKKGAISI